MKPQRKDEVKSSIYWRGEAEHSYYEQLKETAQRHGFKSYSDFVKLILKDPIKALKFSWKFFSSEYDATDTWKLLEGKVPDRDLIQKEAEKMTIEQLRNGLVAQRYAMRLLPIYTEVFSEKLDRKLKELNKFKEERGERSNEGS